MIPLLTGAPALPPPHRLSRRPIEVDVVVFVLVAFIAILPTGGGMDGGRLCRRQWPRHRQSRWNLLHGCRLWHRGRRPVPAASCAPPPPGTSSWDWQVATAWCRCTTRRTLGSTRTCTTIFATMTTTTARMTEARTTTVWRARLHFREIQESVGFLRNPQDFKNSCRKTKKCSCF
jgi:hypothetical protein